MKVYQTNRALAMSLYHRGIRSPFYLHKCYGIPYSTAKRYLQKLRRGSNLDDRPRSGRPPKVTSRLRRQLSQLKSKSPNKPAAFFAHRLSNINGSRIGVRSVRTALHQIGYRWRLRPRHRLTSSQKSQRLAFAQAHRDESWEKIWFFDESYFNLYRHSNKAWVRVDTDDATSLPKLSSKQEKISVGIAVAIRHGRKSALAFLPKNWNAPDLVKEFDSVLFPSLGWSNRIGNQNQLVLDNDGRHFSPPWITYSARKQLRPLGRWPPNSPDFNVVENVFAWLKARVEAMEPYDEPSLRQAIQNAWNDLPLSMTETLVESMPRRLEMSIACNGGRTKY